MTFWSIWMLLIGLGLLILNGWFAKRLIREQPLLAWFNIVAGIFLLSSMVFAALKGAL